MCRLALKLTIAALFITSMAHATDAPAQGEVAITASADREQPGGWSVVVELTLTNVGTDSTSKVPAIFAI